MNHGFSKLFLSWLNSCILARHSLSHLTSQRLVDVVSQNWGPSECMQMATASTPLTRMSLSPPQLCVTTHRTSIFLCAVSVAGLNSPELLPEPQPGALWGTIYQSNHALQTLNTATVFSASLFFAAIFLTSLPLPRSVWTAPLLVQLSPANACKEKWPRLKVMGGTGVPFEWYPPSPLPLEHNAPHFVKTITWKTEKLHEKMDKKNVGCHRLETQTIKQVILILCHLSTSKWWLKIIFYDSKTGEWYPCHRHSVSGWSRLNES